MYPYIYPKPSASPTPADNDRRPAIYTEIKASMQIRNAITLFSPKDCWFHLLLVCSVTKVASTCSTSQVLGSRNPGLIPTHRKPSLRILEYRSKKGTSLS